MPARFGARSYDSPKPTRNPRPGAGTGGGRGRPCLLSPPGPLDCLQGRARPVDLSDPRAQAVEVR